MLAQIVATTDAAHLRLVLLDPSHETVQFFRPLPHIARLKAAFPEGEAKRSATPLTEETSLQLYYLVVLYETLDFRHARPASRQRFQGMQAHANRNRVGVVVVEQSQPPELAFCSRVFLSHFPPARETIELWDEAWCRLYNISQVDEIGRFFVDQHCWGRVSSGLHSTLSPRRLVEIATAPEVTDNVLQEILGSLEQE